jgi:hypothetical protein
MSSRFDVFWLIWGSFQGEENAISKRDFLKSKIVMYSRKIIP